MPVPLAAAGGARTAAVAWSQRRWLLWLLAGLIALPVLLAALSVGLLSGLQSSAPVGSYRPSPLALRDIPAAYLRTYQTAGAAMGGWEYLAAIGKIETDHGRSTAPGVRSGVNSFGCCSGPMQFSVVGQPSTWDTYGVDGNNDGKTSPFDPQDAIPAGSHGRAQLAGPGTGHVGGLRPPDRARRRRDPAPLPPGGRRLLRPQRSLQRRRASTRARHRPRAGRGRQLAAGRPSRPRPRLAADLRRVGLRRPAAQPVSLHRLQRLSRTRRSRARRSHGPHPHLLAAHPGGPRYARRARTDPACPERRPAPMITPDLGRQPDASVLRTQTASTGEPADDESFDDLVAPGRLEPVAGEAGLRFSRPGGPIVIVCGPHGGGRPDP